MFPARNLCRTIRQSLINDTSHFGADDLLCAHRYQSAQDANQKQKSSFHLKLIYIIHVYIHSLFDYKNKQTFRDKETYWQKNKKKSQKSIQLAVLKTLTMFSTLYSTL